MKTLVAMTAVFLFASVSEAAHKPPSLGFGKWDAYMLGVTNAALAECVRKDVSNVTVRIAIANFNDRHDNFQACQMKTLSDVLGLKLEFVKVYAATNEDLHAVYTRAASQGDIVVDYRSYWNDSPNRVLAAVCAVAEHPDKLFVLPYGEIAKCPPTSTSLQGKSRKAYGAGLHNLVTVVPLAPGSHGHVMSPLRRTELDTAEFTFVSPASYAVSAGETCPSASSAAVVAAYAYALSGKKASSRQLVCLMTRGSCIPQQMTDLEEFDSAALANLRQDIERLVTPDGLGRQPLVTPGVLSLVGVRDCFRLGRNSRSGDMRITGM